MAPLAAAPLVGFAAGFLGTLLGIGGGVIIVPVMTLLGFGVKEVVPASLVAILGTSMGGLRYLAGRRLVDYRLAVVLEAASAAGAVTGSALFNRMSPGAIILVFGAVLIALGAVFLARRRVEAYSSAREAAGYRFSLRRGAPRLAGGLAVSYVAGLLSGLLGIGGGVVKVPVLVLVLGLPLHAALSTSKLMVGVTALVALVSHALSGPVDWGLALLLAAGTYAGATVSARVLTRLRAGLLYLVASSYYFAMGAYLLLRGHP